MKGLVSWISLDVHVRFNQTQPYLINGSGEGMRANQDCTNPWYKNHCWAVGMRNDHMSYNTRISGEGTNLNKKVPHIERLHVQLPVTEHN